MLKRFKFLPLAFVLGAGLFTGYIAGLSTKSVAAATGNMRIYTEWPLPAATDGIVRVRKLGSSEAPGGGDNWVVVDVYDGAGNFLGQPFRIQVDSTGFLTADTPGVSGTYFRTNSAGQIQLVGR